MGVHGLVTGEGRGASRVEGSRATLGGLSTQLMACLRVRLAGSLGVGLGGAGGAPRQPRNQRDTVFSLQQQALDALKDLLRPEITVQLRAEEKLAEKKRELDKKKAHLASLDAHQTQMREKQREHAERLLRHTSAVHGCAEQVEILKSEYAQLLNEVQPVSSHPVIGQEVEVSGDEMDSAQLPLPPDDELSEHPDVAKRRKTVGGHMDVDRMVSSSAVAGTASEAAEAVDVVQLRKLCKLQTGDRHGLLVERYRREQLGLEQSAKGDCEAGLGIEAGG